MEVGSFSLNKAMIFFETDILYYIMERDRESTTATKELKQVPQQRKIIQIHRTADTCTTRAKYASLPDS